MSLAHSLTNKQLTSTLASTYSELCEQYGTSSEFSSEPKISSLFTVSQASAEFHSLLIWRTLPYEESALFILTTLNKNLLGSKSTAKSSLIIVGADLSRWMLKGGPCPSVQSSWSSRVMSATCRGPLFSSTCVKGQVLTILKVNMQNNCLIHSNCYTSWNWDNDTRHKFTLQNLWFTWT